MASEPLYRFFLHSVSDCEAKVSKKGPHACLCDNLRSQGQAFNGAVEARREKRSVKTLATRKATQGDISFADGCTIPHVTNIILNPVLLV